jgi:phosphoglycerate dehydrogenase-like enzyme
MKPRIAVLADLAGLPWSPLRLLEELDYGGKVELVQQAGIGNTMSPEFFRDCSAVITRPGSPLLLPEHLRFARRPFHVATISVGRSHLREIADMDDVKLIVPAGTNAGGTASITLSLAELLLRPLHVGSEQMRQGVFDRSPFDRSRRLDGMHWLMVGAGHVSRAMIWQLLSRGARQITVFNRLLESDDAAGKRIRFLTEDIPDGCKSGKIEQVDGGYSTTLYGERNREVQLLFLHGEFDGSRTQIPMIHEADVVSLHVDSTATTKGFFARSQIRQMKAGSLLVNAGRGELVNESSVLEFLASGHLGGYGSDVVYADAENERLHTLSPVWDRFVSDRKLPVEQRLNIVLTPHVGGHVFPDLAETSLSAIRGLLSALGIP